MKKLENKVAVITGAGSGMGRAMAILFAEHGCKVVLADIHAHRLEEVEKEIHQSDGIACTVIANMSKEEDINRMINTAVSMYGTLDILVNNAGVMDNFAPVGEVDDTMWERVMKTNVDGPFKAMRNAIPIFLKKGKGVILNISSIGGLQGARAGAAYTTSKHALIGLTKNTGYMYSKSGIRCNAIAPGAVNTHISESIDMSKVTPLINERIMSGMVTNPRTGEANEIATLALFLVSDDASFVNATVVTADGGWTGY